MASEAPGAPVEYLVVHSMDRARRRDKTRLVAIVEACQGVPADSRRDETMQA